jgi:hypothetical protein
MCIKIIRAEDEIKYDINKPLEEQIRGSKQIVVDYEPNDPSLEKFLDEIERFCQTGISRTFNIKVNHNSSIMGAKVKNKMKMYSKDLELNEVIKSLVNSFSNTDKKLEEIAEMCSIAGCNNVRS